MVVEFVPSGPEDGVGCGGEGFLYGEDDGTFCVGEGVERDFSVGGGRGGGFECEGGDPMVRGLRMLVWSLDL